MSTLDKLRAAVRMRLEANIPVLGNWPQAMAIGAHPSNAVATAQRLHDFVDRVWFLSGDTSTDVRVGCRLCCLVVRCAAPASPLFFFLFSLR